MKPFETERANKIEALSLTSTAVLLFTGVYVIGFPTEGVNIIEYVLLVITLIFIGAFIIIWAYNYGVLMYHGVKEAINEFLAKRKQKNQPTQTGKEEASISEAKKFIESPLSPQEESNFEGSPGITGRIKNYEVTASPVNETIAEQPFGVIITPNEGNHDINNNGSLAEIFSIGCEIEIDDEQKHLSDERKGNSSSRSRLPNETSKHPASLELDSLSRNGNVKTVENDGHEHHEEDSR
jgi:hypothetical protein